MAARAALLAAAALTLYAVRPGVVENGLRSPRVWLVVVALLLAGRGVSLVLQRLSGRPRLARAGGVLVPLVAAGALLAPSFQQRVLVEPFPSPVAAVVPAAPVAVAVAPPATAPVAPPAAPTAPSPAASKAAPRAAVALPRATRPAPPAPSAPRLLSTGALEGVGHSARGRTALYASDGGTVLRFEDVDVEGTPGPVVYLVPLGSRTPDGGVRLGALEAERGSFGYRVPAQVDGEQPWTVLVWCAPYDTPIAAADLS